MKFCRPSWIIGCPTWTIRLAKGLSSLDAVRATTSAPIMRGSWHASALRCRPEPGLLVWECSTDHCWKQRHTTDTLCPTCAAIRRYVHPASHKPTLWPLSNGWSCLTGVRTRRRGMVTLRVNVANTVHLSKHHSYCLQSKQRALRQASRAPSDCRWPWQINYYNSSHDT